jgi:hypothetical protein
MFFCRPDGVDLIFNRRPDGVELIFIADLTAFINVADLMALLRQLL